MCTFAAQRFDLHVLTRMKNTMQIFIQFRRPIVIVKTTACKPLYFSVQRRKILSLCRRLPRIGKCSGILLRHNPSIASIAC